jgi:hypothetical protein
MTREVKVLLALALLCAGPAAAAEMSGARRARDAMPTCTEGRIPVCVSRWNWDCIDGGEVVVDHCDIYSIGCMTEDE